MGAFLNSVRSWWPWALSDRSGQQVSSPSSSLVAGAASVSPDLALQISTIWACVELRASVVASLPFFVYESVRGNKELARNSSLYSLLHDSPNARMTPFEFWRAMMLYHDLRGNAYARIDRAANGEAFALWPMSPDQVKQIVMEDGTIVYEYTIDHVTSILSADSVLHIKNLGNGTSGFAKLDFMSTTANEARQAQQVATNLFASGGKGSGLLMIDKLLKEEQRERLRVMFKNIVEGTAPSLHVLEADMKYQQVNIPPESMQLLQSRAHGVEELCRWMGVPPVMVHHSNVTTWGTGVKEIVLGWHKTSIGPLLKNIEQATRKRVFTSRQRTEYVAEFALDALLRGDISERFDLYAKAVQNGLKTRNECRQLENDPPVNGGDELTAQSNLLPILKLGTVVANGGGGANIAQ
jgi:HK97 family phage portal protein